jgi:hypothetical protein
VPPRLLRILFATLGLSVLLSACDTQSLIDRFTPKAESAFAQQTMALLAAGKLDEVAQRIDPSQQGPELHHTLEQMAALIPQTPARSSHVVGARTSTVNGVTTYDLSYEYAYDKGWLLGELVLRRTGDRLTVVGLHLQPTSRPLAEIHRFTLDGKGPAHYLFLAAALLIPLFMVATLVVCWRTPIATRKWAWMLFIAIGVMTFSINWTTGAWGFQVLAVNLLGSGFFRGSNDGPLMLQFALPLGAVVFLVRRRMLMEEAALAAAERAPVTAPAAP